MDSTTETLLHIKRVNELLVSFAQELLERAKRHDQSKIEEPEKGGFDEVMGVLKGLTYGSDEYKEQLAKLQPILKHHYENNSHHPEHYEEGINGMDLLDVVEMFCDWKAASERHDDGCIYKSIEHNEKRFGMSKQLGDIFEWTAHRFLDVEKTAQALRGGEDE